jgi:hypothetical protein
LCVEPELARCVHVYSVSLYICRVVLLLLRQRRYAAGSGLGTTNMYLRRTTSSAVGNGLGITMKNLRGAVGVGLGTTIKHLRRTTRQRPKHHEQVLPTWPLPFASDSARSGNPSRPRRAVVALPSPKDSKAAPALCSRSKKTKNRRKKGDDAGNSVRLPRIVLHQHTLLLNFHFSFSASLLRGASALF